MTNTAQVELRSERVKDPARATLGNSPAASTQRTKSSLSALADAAGALGSNPDSARRRRSCSRICATSLWRRNLKLKAKLESSLSHFNFKSLA